MNGHLRNMASNRILCHTPSVLGTPGGSLELTQATVLVDGEDYEGVHIAATFLAEDVGKVTRGQKLDVRRTRSAKNDQVEESSIAAPVIVGCHETIATAIIVGCIETSPLMQHLDLAGKMDFSSIRGKWECFATDIVDSPLPGCQRALVIAGSNKRGAIYGVYTLSEEMGVSP